MYFLSCMTVGTPNPVKLVCTKIKFLIWIKSLSKVHSHSAFPSYKGTGETLEKNLPKEELYELKILHKNKDIIVQKSKFQNVKVSKCLWTLWKIEYWMFFKILETKKKSPLSHIKIWALQVQDLELCLVQLNSMS